MCGYEIGIPAVVLVGVIKTLKAAMQGKPFGWDKPIGPATVEEIMHEEPVRGVTHF